MPGISPSQIPDWPRIASGAGLPPHPSKSPMTWTLRGVGRPHREVDGVTGRVTADAAHDVRAEALVDAPVGSFREQVQVDVAEARHERSMVAELASSRL